MSKNIAVKLMEHLRKEMPIEKYVESVEQPITEPPSALQSMAKDAGEKYSDAERYYEEAKKQRMESTGKTESELSSRDYEYIMGVVKKRLGLSTEPVKSASKKLGKKNFLQEGNNNKAKVVWYEKDKEKEKEFKDPAKARQHAYDLLQKGLTHVAVLPMQQQAQEKKMKEEKDWSKGKEIQEAYAKSPDLFQFLADHWEEFFSIADAAEQIMKKFDISKGDAEQHVKTAQEIYGDIQEPVMASKKIKPKKEIKEEDGNYLKKVYKMLKEKDQLSKPEEHLLKETEAALKTQGVDLDSLVEQNEDDYTVTARGISDEDVAKKIATDKGGQMVKDDQDENKYMVIVKESNRMTAEKYIELAEKSILASFLTKKEELTREEESLVKEVEQLQLTEEQKKTLEEWVNKVRKGEEPIKEFSEINQDDFIQWLKDAQGLSLEDYKNLPSNKRSKLFKEYQKGAFSDYKAQFSVV